MASRPIFVGRAAELAALERVVAEGASLVTVWGPGGAGKTTLVRAYVDRARARLRTIVWVELASARTRAEALGLVASALGVAEKEEIAHAASAQRALVVADNLEQLDGDAIAAIVDLARADHVRVLGTSRSPIGASSEATLELGPLPDDDAVALLEAHAGGAVDAPVARALVERLDGLPLAIELAGARVPLLGAEELLERLRASVGGLGSASKRPLRHATLRAAIEWSWDLLDEDERDALRACATFEAPFDATLAERVIGRVDALDLLERLRTRALLRTGPPDERGRPQLRLLEAVRELARERVGDGDSAEPARARHAAAVEERTSPLAALVAQGGAVPSELTLRRADLVIVARRGSERAAHALAVLLSVTGPLDSAIEVCRGVAAESARIAILLADALRGKGDLRAAKEALERARALAKDPIERAGVHRCSASIARALGDLARAVADAEEGLALARAAGDVALEGLCLGELGAVHQSEGRFGLARSRHAEAIAIHVATKSRRAEGIARSFLAVATHRSGAPRASLALHEEALAIHREVGHRRLEGAELLHLGWVRHEIGDPGSARASLEEARQTLAGAGARGLEALANVLLARLAVDEGDTTAAEIHLAEAARLTPIGWPRLEATRRVVEGHLALSRGDAPSAVRAYQAALAASTTVEVGFEALTPAYLAFAIARAGGLADAALVGEARALAGRFENPTLAAALDVLEGKTTEPSAEMLRSSSDVRRALAFRGARRALVVSDEGRRVILPDGTPIDLARRKNVRLVLVALAEARRSKPGVPLDPEALVAAGWPGEKMRADAAQKRLHTAIWTLRSAGLEDILRTRDGGYFLDPAIPLEL